MATMRRSPIFRMLLATALGTIIMMAVVPGLALGVPLVAITRPTQGATVSGVIWIDVAFRSDSNRPITRLEIYIDDTLAREVDLATPLLEGRQSFNWDFSYVSNTTHKIAARAIDSANAAAAASITVQVQNAAVAGPDRIPPVVRIYYPAQGARLRGQVEVKAEATDNTGVELVYFYIDGRLHKMMMNAPPYVDSWDTTREADGSHVLEAVAVDAAENEARSAQVTVVVENHNMTLMNNGATQQPTTPLPGTLVPNSLPGTQTVPAPTYTSLPAPAVPAPTTVTAPPVNPPAPAPAPVVAVPAPWQPLAPPVIIPQSSSAQPASTPRSDVALSAPAPAPTGLQPAASLPAPSQPALSTPAPTGTKDPAVAPLLSLTGPKVAVVTPRAEGPGPVPQAPTSVASLLSLGTPQTLPQSHTDQLVAAPAPAMTARTTAAGLAKPGATLAAPSATAAVRTAPKATAPTLTREPASLSTGTQMAVAPSAAALEPVSVAQPTRTAAGLQRLQPLTAATPLAPAVTSASLPSSPVARTSSPGKLAAAPRPSLTTLPSAAQRVEPVGPAVPTTAAAKPVDVKPTTTLAPAKVAGLTRPSMTPAVLTQAALAEYRGFPVPASRMLAMLPSTEAGKLPADGKVTLPSQVTAAVPIAVAKVRDIRIVFDGEILSLRTAPETRRGISLAPLREIFEKTDGQLYWFPVEKKVQAVNKDVDVRLSIGSQAVTVNGETQKLQIAPYIKQGRTMVPLQFIADVLDVKIAVDNTTGQILISSNQF